MASELEALRARIAALEDVCGAAYQLAGTIGAPVRFLDALAAGAGGGAIPPVDLLPVSELECEAVNGREKQLAQLRAILGVSAAAELGRVGGSKISAAKQEAARANGQKGGRPRKAFVAYKLAGKADSGAQTKLAATAPGFAKSFGKPRSATIRASAKR